MIRQFTTTPRRIETYINDRLRFESAGRYALISGKSWKLPPEKIEALKKSCITKLCKESTVVRQ